MHPDRRAESEVGDEIDDVGAEQGQGAPSHPPVAQPRVALVQDAPAHDPQKKGGGRT